MNGLVRYLIPEPLSPQARIVPLDQAWANYGPLAISGPLRVPVRPT